MEGRGRGDSGNVHGIMQAEMRQREIGRERCSGSEGYILGVVMILSGVGKVYGLVQ